MDGVLHLSRVCRVATTLKVAPEPALDYAMPAQSRSPRVAQTVVHVHCCAYTPQPIDTTRGGTLRDAIAPQPVKDPPLSNHFCSGEGPPVFSTTYPWLTGSKAGEAVSCLRLRIFS